ncbi:MAG: hypothetical protein ACE5EE_11515, partial [Fidelibacterota bacterium]
DGAFGLFLDKDNSLLVSFLASGPRFYNARINIYPGIISFKRYSPGIYLGFGEVDGFQIGITTGIFPIGIANSF